MAASPSPMTRCHVPIAVASAASGIGAAPRPRTGRRTRTRPRGHATTAPMPAGNRPEPRGRTERVATEDGVTGPRPDDRHEQDVGAEGADPAVGEEERLDRDHDREAHGRRGRARRAPPRATPPSRWPDVPAPTGKVTICAAKTNTATSPASGATRSSSSCRAERTTQRPRTTPAATTAVADRGRGVEEAVGDVHALLLAGSGVLVAHYSQQGAIASNRAGPATDLRVTGRGVRRAGHQRRRSPCTVLLASSTMRFSVRCTAVSEPGSTRTRCSPGRPAPTASATTALIGSPWLTATHTASLPCSASTSASSARTPPTTRCGHLAPATRRRTRRPAGRSRRRGRPARPARAAPSPHRRASDRSSRRSGTPPAGRRDPRRDPPGPRMPSRGSAAAGWRRRGRW